MTDKDAEAIRSAIIILDKCLPKSTEPPAVADPGPGHSAEPTEPELASTLIRVRMADMICKKLLLRRANP